MATYGIVVEGDYDVAALTEMIKKCQPGEIEIIPRPCRGKDQLMKSFRGFLDSFQYENKGSPVDKALVIRDAGGRDPDELLESMRSRIAGRTYPFEIKFIIIVQELETWLLTDEEAISRVTQSRSGRTVSKVNEDLESIIQPKERLKKILSDAKVP